tara:strand:- start:57 stop:248 length:192 start_codon:yes stop_codon:yes gene_type:complete
MSPERLVCRIQRDLSVSRLLEVRDKCLFLESLGLAVTNDKWWSRKMSVLALNSLEIHFGLKYL